LFLASAVVCFLLLLRAHELNRFNAGWGDAVADRKHNLLWYGTLAFAGVSVAAAVLLARASRRAFYSIALSAAITLLLSVLTRFGTHTFKSFVFLPLLPGYVAALDAFNVHESSTAFEVWFFTVNTLFYSPIVYAMLRSPSSELR
jgi:hypothetical protein